MPNTYIYLIICFWQFALLLKLNGSKSRIFLDPQVLSPWMGTCITSTSTLFYNSENGEKFGDNYEIIAETEKTKFKLFDILHKLNFR